MNGKVVLKYVAVCAGGVLLIAGNASGQFTSRVKVSDVIEGSAIQGVSAARCGSNIVVGFGDSEAGKSASRAGVSVSKDGGKTFAEVGTLPASDSTLSIGGDNSGVACANASTFYYAVPAFIETTDPNSGICVEGCTEIAVASSTNGGSTWNSIVAASVGSADNKQFLSPSIAVDPTNPKRMYIAYLNYNGDPPDFSDCFGFGEPTNVVILEMVTSVDGGHTWNGRSNPGSSDSQIAFDHSCPAGGTDPARTGVLASPNVVVSPGGKVYLTYSLTGTNSTTGTTSGNQIRFMRSLDGGVTFSTPIDVSRDAIDNAAPKLAVDRTGLRSRGEIYLTWTGTPTGTYTDVLVSDSVNFGLSFSFPRPISPAPAAGTGRYQANPTIAVDNDGQVAACFYNTNNNQPTSSSVYAYDCALSFNRAAGWARQQVASAAPAGFDSVTNDFLLHNDGFFTAFELQASGQRHVVGERADNP